MVSHQKVIKKLAALLSTVFMLLLVIPTASAEFSDVPQEHGNYASINYLQETGVIAGYEDGTFRPGQPVNRAEALKIILEGIKAETSETTETNIFTDVSAAQWFGKYVKYAKDKGIVSGNPDGTFAPAREVARAEFVKMLLNTNGFNPEKWQGQALFPDVPQDAWFNPFMNYAGKAGLVMKDAEGNLNPSQALNRGEVAEIMYLMTIILKGNDTQFLVTQAEMQMGQIDIYVGANNPVAAKRAAELAVDMTQQAYRNMPEDNIVLSSAKIARAYDFVMNAYITAVQKKNDEARSWAEQAIAKATEAWEANNNIQPIAAHIKDRANEIISQLPSQ